MSKYVLLCHCGFCRSVDLAGAILQQSWCAPLCIATSGCQGSEAHVKFGVEHVLIYFIYIRLMCIAPHPVVLYSTCCGAIAKVKGSRLVLHHPCLVEAVVA